MKSTKDPDYHTVNPYTVNRCLVRREELSIPDRWRLVIINHRSVVMRRGGIRISIYQLRAYDPDRAGAVMYFRRRRDGYQPRVIATRSSGSGPPKWMLAAMELLDPRAVRSSESQLRELHEGLSEPLDMPLDEWLQGVDALLATIKLQEDES